MPDGLGGRLLECDGSEEKEEGEGEGVDEGRNKSATVTIGLGFEIASAWCPVGLHELLWWGVVAVDGGGREAAVASAPAVEGASAAVSDGDVHNS